VFCGAHHALGNTGRETAHLVVEADLTLGASLTMIDRNYGHLARDGGEHAIRLRDELNTPAVDVVDARWTLAASTSPLHRQAPVRSSGPRNSASLPAPSKSLAPSSQ
jgi:hypothetical protein